jgi:hypothetical protein
VQVGNPATAFATVINTLVGTPNTPVDIVARGLQTYVFALTPTVAFSPTDVELTFDCFNTNPAPVIYGVNTLPAASVTTSINTGATPTFTIFVNGNDFVSFEPANNRVFVRFQDAGGVTRGSTSVALETI